jgi:hypothetical protein
MRVTCLVALLCRHRDQPEAVQPAAPADRYPDIVSRVLTGLLGS